MSTPKDSLLRIYGFALFITVLLLALVGFREGWSAFFTVLILAGLEVTFSFDNAIVNAKILHGMSRIWQTIFMTVGIFIAVFLVRILMPISIVSATSATGFSEVVKLALHNPAAYTEKLDIAQPMISTFGGIFLLMIFLDFVFERRKIKWLKKLETALARVGKIENLSTTIALGVLLATSFGLVDGDDRTKVLVAGLVGLIIYLAVNALDSLSGFAPEVESTTHTKIVKAGVVGFLYLELIDASFSLDGVIGAFALTKNILLIAAGLGIGALFVRSMTVHVMRRGVLAKYPYLEHGAHYAIGILAIIMLLSVKLEVPEFVTGGAGIVVIVAALIQSRLHSKSYVSHS